MAVEAPSRAREAATVPITVTAQIPQTEARYIKSLTLIVDENPALIVGTFHFSTANAIASLSTRVRVNAYTNIRAMAETGDGKLHMADAYVREEEHKDETQYTMRTTYAADTWKKNKHNEN